MNINCEIVGNTFIQGSINDGTHSLLRAIAKIDKGYSGSISIDDNNIKMITDKDIDLAYVSKDPYLFKRNISYNLYYPLMIRKFDKNSAKELINEVIDKYIKDFPTQISRLTLSQKKIIALLRAMIRQPKYILIEDLFTNLDEQYHNLAEQIVNEISTHSIVIACDNAVVNCYNHYEQYRLEFGSLTKII